MRFFLLVVVFSILVGGCYKGSSFAQEEKMPMPHDHKEIEKYPSLIVGGGCFWCLEAIYQEIEGVVDAVSGYAGGEGPDPTYESVCAGEGNFAEVVQVYYDPQEVSEEELLEIFFRSHNPTTLNRQGNDVGPQYRSIVLYQNQDQKGSVEKAMEQAEKQAYWKDPLVTELVPLEKFFRAEEYHQDYFAKNPYKGYCQLVVSEKVDKVRENFPDKIKK